MPDLFDTSQVPDDAMHWDVLAERVAANAAREAGAGGFDWFARSRANRLAVSLLVAAALTFMVFTAEDSSAKTFSTMSVLTPADDLGKTMVSHDGPPAIGALLLGGMAGSVR